MNNELNKVSQLIATFNSDVDFAINNLNSSKEDEEEFEFLARSYIRAVASWAEGIIWVLKHAIIHAEGQWHKNLPLESQLYLFEHDWKLSNSGQPKLTSKKLKTEENLKGFFYVAYEIFGGEKADYSGQGWEDLKYFYKVRNQMMHPSNLDSFQINKKCLDKCENGRLWLKSNLNEVLDRVAKAANKT